jgi:hypothetical protein
MTPNREQIEAEPAGPRLNAWVGEALCLPKRFRCPKCGGDYFRGDAGRVVPGGRLQGGARRGHPRQGGGPVADGPAR